MRSGRGSRRRTSLPSGMLESSPLREQIQARMTELWNYEKYSPPVKRGGRYFFSHNNGLQNQDVVYWLADLDDELTHAARPEHPL
jgi:prolyl oligopeptidase